ncbi:hypothetical protein YY07_004855, partial [Salmonella enterica subsp. enterica]|nr:hypothetical protein [Salmonella enterica subsp. enterica]
MPDNVPLSARPSDGFFLINIEGDERSMKKRSKWASLLLVSGLSFTLLLSGCGGGNNAAN